MGVWGSSDMKDKDNDTLKIIPIYENGLCIQYIAVYDSFPIRGKGYSIGEALSDAYLNKRLYLKDLNYERHIKS